MILVGLGANLPGKFGSPADTIAAALVALTESGLRVDKVSRLWLTAPVPVSDQPWYHNAVASIETVLSPLAIFRILQKIENDFGRVRLVRNEPRVLDLDLLGYHDLIQKDPQLILPHPRLHERGFVLLPLQDIAPDWTYPGTGATLSTMIAALPADQKGEPL